MANTWCRFILFCMMVGAAGAAVVGRGGFPPSQFGRRGFNQRDQGVVLLVQDDSNDGLGGGLGSLLLLSVLMSVLLPLLLIRTSTSTSTSTSSTMMG